MIKKITFLAVLLFASLQIATAQTFFSDDFSDLDISDWTVYDVDGDTYSWEVGDWSAVGPAIAEFNHVLVSRSWIGGGVGGLNPDNYIVSSAIDLTGAGAGLQLQYAYGTIEAAPFHVEEYSIYVTTSDNLATIQGATAIHNEILSVPSSRQTNTLDLSAYAGQTVYLTFRHHNTFDENTMIIDDVVVRIPVDTDAIVEAVQLPRYSLVSTNNQLSLDVTNNGSLAITSLEVNWNDGSTDHVSTINTNIAPGATASVSHPTMVNYATVQEKDITVTVSMVNGAADESPSDNDMDAKFNTMSQAGTKVVLIEESTGTWCGWCPRGTVGLDYMTTSFPNSVATIAVHNDDPMMVPAYDAALVGVIGTGWPNSGIDRKLLGVDPGQASLLNGYNTQTTETVPVNLNTSASLVGNTLTISAQANFYTKFSASNFRLGVIMTEDGVTGTSSGYNHVNYYAGGGNGPMGGYENLPDPVPAAQMVYNHVGRAILGGFNGQAGSVPVVINDGDTVSYDFNYTIPATSDQANMHIVVVLIDQTDGTIVSGFQRSVADALSVRDFSIAGLKIFPNPANDILNISFESGKGNYSINIIDMLGRTVINQKFNDVFGVQNIEIPVATLSQGYYILNVSNEKSTLSTKFIKN
ncbi:Omp28-related outer membrane protein [Psychroserpens sp.]